MELFQLRIGISFGVPKSLSSLSVHFTSTGYRLSFLGRYDISLKSIPDFTMKLLSFQLVQMLIQVIHYFFACIMIIIRDHNFLTVFNKQDRVPSVHTIKKFKKAYSYIIYLQV